MPRRPSAVPRSIADNAHWTALLVVGLVAASLAGCGTSYEPDLPPRDQLHYPIGLAMHPNGRFLYVVNSNFNARYRPDSGGTVSVVDLRSMELRPQGTPFIPSFGGSIELNDDASRIYTVAREGDALVALRVSGQTAGAAAGASVYCVDDEGRATSNPENCAIRRIPRKSSGAPFAADPFGVSVTTLRRDLPDDDADREVPIDVVSMSYLGSNRVTTVSIPDRRIANASVQTAALIAGGNAITRRPDSLSYYVAGRNSSTVAQFSPFLNLQESGSFGRVEALFRQGEIRLSNFRTDRGRISSDARGIAFDGEGDRLFVASRRPDALYVFDLVASNPETGGGLSHELSATIPLSNNPSDILLHERPDGRMLAYVPSFADEAIDVVDPGAERIVDVIELPASPYEMVVDRAPNRCDQPGAPCRGYVTLFRDTGSRSGNCGANARQCGALGVVDLDPTSARYHQLIQKIR